MPRGRFAPAFGASLAKLASSTEDGPAREAAEALDCLLESGEISGELEFKCALFAALGYDIAGEPRSARRMYRRLSRARHPDLSHFLLSGENSKLVTGAFEDAGMRDSAELGSKLSLVKSDLGRRKELVARIDGAYVDNYAVLLAALSLLADAVGAAASHDVGGMEKAAASAVQIYDGLDKFSTEPWIEIVAALSMRLICRMAGRPLRR